MSDYNVDTTRKVEGGGLVWASGKKERRGKEKDEQT